MLVQHVKLKVGNVQTIKCYQNMTFVWTNGLWTMYFQAGRVWTAPSRAPVVPGDLAAIRHVSVPTGQLVTPSTEPAPAHQAGGMNSVTYRVL